MNRILLLPDGEFDRSAIMREAHYQFRVMGHRGWTFHRCLSFAWKKAQAQRERGLMDAMAYVIVSPRPPVRASTARALHFPHVFEEPSPTSYIAALS